MNSTRDGRKLLHSRQISCDGYQRDDGLWDIEAQLTDTKTYDLLHPDGSLNLKAGEPLHQMRLCVTVDATLTIVDATAHTVHGPHGECPQINDAYAALKGLTIGSGFIAAVKLRFKGAGGCTHLTELIGTVATVAYQTLWPVLALRYAANDQAGGDPARKPAPTIGTCFALRADGDVVRMRWPRYDQSLLPPPTEQT
jgi:hypothetical protein